MCQYVTITITLSHEIVAFIYIKGFHEQRFKMDDFIRPAIPISR
jgi:hypothetical protein